MKTLQILKKEYQRTGYDENDITKVEYTEVIAQYNDSGLLLREERYDPDGNLNTLSVNTYDDNMLLIQSEQYDTDRILLQKNLHHYDEQQQLQWQKNFFGADDTEYITRYIYDAEGNVLRHENYCNGQLDFVERELMYENGMLIKESENDDYGELLNMHQYKYNEKGLLIKHICDEVQNKDRRTYEYTYDENDNCIKELVYDYGNSLIAKVYRTYNENLKLAEIEEEDLDNYRKIIMEYDGDLVAKNSMINKEGQIIGWAEYTYDDTGKENSAREFIQDEIRPENFRMFRETIYIRG